jgi:flagellar biogenesis protein FliO
MGDAEAPAEGGDEKPAGSDYDFTKQIMQAVAALFVVVAIILVLYYLMSRLGKKTPILAGASLGNVLGRIHLDPKTCLYFVRVKDRVLVVGVNPQSIATVAEMDAAQFEGKQAATTDKSAVETFRQILEEKSGALEPPFATTPEVADLAGLRDELEKVQQSLEALDAETKEETPREP